MGNPGDEARRLADEAAFHFAVGDERAALGCLDAALSADPACFEAWLSAAEIHFASRRLDEALAAAERALQLRPKDIWMERGDKTKAEHHGAQARIFGWGQQLKEPETGSGDLA
jgi:tetratricopeptide (TPR) repeat protein